MATVYDKSSLFLAPSGVSNGTVFVQKPVPIYGSEQVTNGDFSQTGAEQVTNGDFATDTDWNKTNSVISGGVATITSTGYAFAAIVQTNALTVGKAYKATIDVKSVTGGLVVGGTSDTITSSGIISVYFTASQTYLEIKRDGVYATTIAEIDNVSVKEVGQDWVLGTGISIGDDEAIFTSVPSGQQLAQLSLSGVVGKTYKISYEIKSRTLGAFSASIGTTLSANQNSSVGVYTEYLTATTTAAFYIRSRGTTSGSITNISVQEVLSPDGDFTFTRGSNLSATRVNEAQLIEKGRENVLLQSNQFDTTWITSSALALSGYAGRNGGTNAWLLREQGSTSPHWVRQSSGLTSGIGTFSFYAKKKDYDWIQFGQSGDGGNYANFNIANGTLGNSTSAFFTDISITSVGNGWYRCSVTYTFASNSFVGIALIRSDVSSRYEVYQGDNISGTYIQDAQVELGLVATDYIETGASTAQAGLLENTPRLDYGGGATCPSLLLEPSRSNLVVNSEYFGPWTPTSASVVSNDALSPEGLTNASKLLAQALFSNHQIDSQYYPIVSGSVVGSVYAKKGNIDFIRLRFDNTSSNIRGWFDLENGVVGSVDGGGEGKIESVGNGWYRCTLIESGNTSVGSSRLQLFLNESDTQTSWTANGDEYIHIWGAQTENPVSYPTSYIPTYGTSQTRADESIADLDTSSLLTQSNNNTYFAEVVNHRNTGNTRFIASYDSARSNEDRILIYSGNASTSYTLHCQYKVSGETSIQFNIATNVNYGDTIKFAVVFNGTEMIGFANGVKTATATIVDADNFNKFDITDTANELGVFKQLLLFPTALSDLDAKILTGATTYETFDEMALALNYTVYE